MAKSILFVCVENAGRSQMAEAFAKKYGKKENFSSAGTNPVNEINPMVVLVMKEKGIDISKNKPKALTTKMVQKADLVVTMGCGAQGICVGPLFKPTVDWILKDPKSKPVDEVRKIRDEIESKVKKLLRN